MAVAAGGTYYGFCTGAGKSYAIFILPNSAAPGSTDVQSLAEGCSDYINLLKDFNRCVQKGGEDAGLHGVIALPTQGVFWKIPRPNHYATTFDCTPGGWLTCFVATIAGREVSVFAVNLASQ